MEWIESNWIPLLGTIQLVIGAYIHFRIKWHTLSEKVAYIEGNQEGTLELTSKLNTLQRDLQDIVKEQSHQQSINRDLLKELTKLSKLVDKIIYTSGGKK